ncbi:hypothetical protein ABEB36_014236 [Hypothenemus hampei]|uniref:Syntaxin N-terminal domain-containing protein n=1 Tax=Hypothenemus hampei TaxID=57062 RepID=A0ABD1E416_HYPHA
MAKDRLGDFVKKTKEKNNVASVQIEAESEPLIGGGNLRQVLDRAGVIRQWIETIENNVLTLREYIRKLDDLNANKKDLNEKIESLFRNNTSISQQIQGKLKELELELQQEANSNSTEQRIKSIQFNTLKTCYIKAFQCNADELEAFRNLKKSQLDAQLRAKGVKLTEEELNNFLEDGTDIQVFTENVLNLTAMFALLRQFLLSYRF